MQTIPPEPPVPSDQQYAANQIRQFRTDSASQIVASGPKKSRLLVSRVRRDAPDHGFATPAKPDAVYSVLVQLRQQDSRELYLDDKLVHRGSYPMRTTSVVNHWQRPKANLLSAFDTVIFTVPQAALNAAAHDNGARSFCELACENEGRFDETVWSLAQSLLPALDRPDEVGAMYAERVLLASTTYFAHAFGGMRPALGPPHRLTQDQAARAAEIMLSDPAGDISLSILAAELDLTPREFAGAFKRTLGETPDRWLRRQRVERAKTLMRQTALPLAEVASLCGFVSSAHFTRVFGAFVGASPQAWRTQVLN